MGETGPKALITIFFSGTVAFAAIMWTLTAGPPGPSSPVGTVVRGSSGRTAAISTSSYVRSDLGYLTT